MDIVTGIEGNEVAVNKEEAVKYTARIAFVG